MTRVVRGSCIWATGLGLCLCLSVSAARAQEPASAAGATRKVGTVDLFGYAGWDRDDPNTAALRKKLASRLGAEVRLAAVVGFRRQVQGEVIAVTGKPATDVAVICCNKQGELNVFVGMQGESSIPLEQRATPTGSDTLPPEAMALYAQERKAAQEVMTRYVSEVDPREAYTLSSDPALRAAQAAMREFSAKHNDVVLHVLRRSGSVEQRRAAAALLEAAARSPAQAERSSAQVRALEDAIDDDDEEVRNDAVNALAIMAHAGPLPGLNVQQIIGLLYSGVWTDRNQAGRLLLVMEGDPKLLKALAEEALPPLIEGARWQSKTHAMPFAMVLGRVVGMPDERSSALFNGGQVADIVSAAEALEKKGNKR